METFFSIVIPTLNEERYLPRLMKSLSKQTLKSFEVIVVDGGSTDKTVELALAHANKVVVERCNQAKARNIGASLSKGRYLVFLDADAAVDPVFLERARGLFDEFKAGCLVGRPEPVRPTRVGRLGFAFGWLLAKVKATFPGYMGILVERNVFKKAGGFNPNLSYGEDLDFLRRVSFITKIYYPKSLVVYSDTRRWMKNGKVNPVEVTRLVYMVMEYMLTGRSSSPYPVIR